MKFRKTKCETCIYAMHRKRRGGHLSLDCYHPALLSKKDYVSLKLLFPGGRLMQTIFSPYLCPCENEKDVLRWYRSLTGKNEILEKDLPEDA